MSHWKKWEDVRSGPADTFVRLMETAGAASSGLFGTRLGRTLGCVAEASWIDSEGEVSRKQLLFFFLFSFYNTNFEDVKWKRKLQKRLQSNVRGADSLSCAAQTSFGSKGLGRGS